MPSTPSHSGGDTPRRRGRRRRRRLRTVNETSAGGLVVDPELQHAAIIGRMDRKSRLLWSFPKGHIETGETAEEAAVREVREETGIIGTVLEPLGTIDYWFVAENKRVHKTVHHFLLQAVDGELSDDDVEVTEVAWAPLPDLTKLLAYTDERRLADHALARIQGGLSPHLPDDQSPDAQSTEQPHTGTGST